MADIAFTCPDCGHAYQFSDRLAGKRGRCKKCQAVFRIPVPVSAPPPAVAPAPVQVVRPPATSRSPSPSTPPADDGKIVFNCASCGHGYRLDAKLAGKQGRCTTCRAVFTIPTRSSPPGPPRSTSPQKSASTTDRPAPPVAADPIAAWAPTRPAVAATVPPVSRGVGSRPPALPLPAADDSGWWDLDSSESLATTSVPAPSGPSRSAGGVVEATPMAWNVVGDDEPIVTAELIRPQWVTYAAVGAGALAGVIAFAVTYSLLSNGSGPSSPPVAEQPNEEPAPTIPQPAVADTPRPGSSPPSSPRPAGTADRHREAIDALVRAYNEIADGYARIRDAGSIDAGNGPISHGVAELRSAAQRGRSLPPLSPSDRQALSRQTGPALIDAVNRVLGELRRLQATQGLRADFDRLIDAYTRTREGFQREVDRR